MDFDWKKLVKTVAPTIASALGGPLAGMAVTAITGALGIEAKDVAEAEQKISEVLAAPDPGVLLKLRQADQDFKVQLRKLDIDLEKIHAADRASARQREIALKDKMPGVLAVILTVGFFGVLAAHLFIHIPSENKTLLDIMLGSLGTAWVTMITYYYGSSKGSKIKDVMLASGGVKP